MAQRPANNKCFGDSISTMSWFWALSESDCFADQLSLPLDKELQRILDLVVDPFMFSLADKKCMVASRHPSRPKPSLLTVAHTQAPPTPWTRTDSSHHFPFENHSHPAMTWDILHFWTQKYHVDSRKTSGYGDPKSLGVPNGPSKSVISKIEPRNFTKLQGCV